MTGKDFKSLTEWNNPWADRAALPAFPRRFAVLSMLAFLCGSFAIPFLSYRWVAFPAALLMLAYLAVTTRVFRSVLFCAIAGLLALLFGGSATFAALAVILIAGTCAGAYLVTVFRPAHYLILLPIVSWVAAYLITKDLALSCTTLAFLPSALLLGAATLTGQRRTTAILFAEGGLLLVVGILLWLFLKENCDVINGANIKALLDDLRGQAVEAFQEIREELIRTFAETATASQAEAYAEEINTIMSDTVLTNLIAAVFNLLPAVVVVSCSILAYLAQETLCALYFSVGAKVVLTPNATAFSMSVPSAVIYLVTFVISLFSQTVSLFFVITENLMLILLPGFLLIGFHNEGTRFRQMRGGAKALSVILLVAMFLFSPVLAVEFVASWGAIAMILASIAMRMIQNGKGPFGGAGNPPDDSDSGDGSDGPDE